MGDEVGVRVERLKERKEFLITQLRTFGGRATVSSRLFLYASTAKYFAINNTPF
jgi:hypothetical protein